MSAHPQSALRLLAPAALVAFAIVFLVVVIASLGGESDNSGSERAASVTAEQRQRDRAAARRERQRTRPVRGNPRFYVVRRGDNLALIATRTGVSLEQLRALNPTLDPQGLVTGQRIRLRESEATGATGASGASGATGVQGDATSQGGVPGE
jgi:hypothetical protein